MSDGKLPKFVHRTIINIEVNRSLYAVNVAEIRMLPKAPWPFIPKPGDVIVCYPEWVALKFGSIKMLLPESKPGVDDGDVVLAFFHGAQPL